jgi:LysM repeat protein
MLRVFLLAVFCGAICLTTNDALAQTAAGELSQLEILGRKIDAQNTKIDALSQQILKLQQELAQSRGETVGVPETTPTPATAGAVVPPGGSATHVVTKGETLTSIARQYKVTVADLEKINHIENDRKMQIGQTLVIPGPSATPAATPNE